MSQSIIAELSEAELTQLIIQIASRVSRKYKFGYHSEEDMAAQAVMEAWEVLAANKFVYGEDRSKDEVRKRLSGFLATHMRNRLHNFRRNHSCRYESENNKYNSRKYNVMHPVKMGDLMDNAFSQSVDAEKDERNESIKYIRSKLPPELIKDFLKLQNGVPISARRREVLIETMREINAG